MRRIISLIAIFLLSLSSVMGQLIPINLPADGNWPTIVGDSIMIIGPRQNELTEEQRYFNPVYLMTYPGKEHLKAQMIRAGACDCDPTKSNRRIGVFSVAPDKKVSFSQGNLQYLPAINLWKFADTQYEYLGNANKYLKPTFRNWVDLFGWSANNTTAPFGVSTSMSAADYAGDFVDWGTNAICGDAPGTWRTLSREEWEYLINNRANAKQLCGVACVHGVNGLILLPDDWIAPTGISFTSGTHDKDGSSYFAQVNDYTIEQWQRMEESGAVFLPTAGVIRKDDEIRVGSRASYWSSTGQGTKAYILNFHSNFIITYNEVRYAGRSVRLVHDTIVSKIEPEYVDLGLSVKWATFNVGATSPEDYGDYFAWGETEPKEVYSWATYKWGTSSNQTKYNTTDGKTILDIDDDAAYVNWGGDWRMPSKEEVDELTQQCNWIWTTLNNVNGYKVTGPNGNSIFLPAAGYKGSGPTYPAGEDGLYWTSTLEKGHYSYLIVLHNDAPPTEASTKGTRCFGFTIRPVYDDRPPKRIGVFSVTADKQVSFSQGNLQYIQSTDTWQFAANQLEYMGHKHYRNGQLADTIEYFGWSGKNSKAPWGISLSTESSDYAGEFLDWGTNTIAGSAPNTWRTLSNDEWLYICQGRKNADQLLGLGKISSIFGLIILPDDWVAPEGITFTPNDNNPNANVYSLQQWTAMEEAGAIFIPPTGYFNHDIDNMRYVGTYGYARNNTLTANGLQIYTLFKPSEIQYSRSAEGNNGNLYYAFPQRLVHDTIVPKPEPEYVDLGLSVKWATFNVGATSSNEIGNFYAWGEIEPKDTYTVNNYKWWNKSSKEITKYCTIDSLAYGGIADGLTDLQPQDDIAHILKGEHWRMPDLDECKELGNGCTWTVSTRQGQIGFEGTSKINGNTIFLPVVGFRAGVNLVHETLGGYWSSTLNIEKQSCAMGLYLNLETPSVGIYYNSSRQNGFLIRPVYDEVPDPCLVVKVNDTISINLMCVEGGTFTMGDDNISNASPAHQVTLSDYYIGETEVTQTLWKAVMGNVPTGNKNPSYPVGYVSYADCQDFIAKLNNLTGLHFQLPTEAEWEYAAMGGNKSHNYIYSGSNTIDDVAWYDQNSENKLHHVGTKQPNELGIYDMSGNAWEWCADYYGKYTAENQINPQGPATGTDRVIRSGSFRTTADRCTNKHRQAREADYPDSHITLRLVLHDTVPVLPEPEYVDLGLSVKWATFNVGATSPEDDGDYFAWGETETKENYNWATYKWCDGTDRTMTKYCTNSQYGANGFTDGKTILEPEDDAAYVHWGGKWRMPSDEEFTELREKCTWTWTTLNGVDGYEVIGPNNKSIFLPATGYKRATNDYSNATSGFYWSNTLSTDKDEDASKLNFSSNGTFTRDGIRYDGNTIRPVYDDVPEPCLVVKVNDTLSINLMCVEGGTFMMGSDAGDAEADEQPVHEVTLSDYYIGQTEVTQHLWKAVMGSSNNPSATKGNNLPVTNISWNDAQRFVERLSELTGLYFRLPTEAEWEYAARGGQYSRGYKYAGSNDIDQVGWYNGNSSNKTHIVGQKQPNELGIYDMTGNVWEYCYDWHTPYAAQAQTNPTGAATGDKHVLRGGCYHYDPKNCTNTNRHSYYTPDKGGASTGLRIVLEP